MNIRMNYCIKKYGLFFNKYIHKYYKSLTGIGNLHVRYLQQILKSDVVVILGYISEILMNGYKRNIV